MLSTATAAPRSFRIPAFTARQIQLTFGPSLEYVDRGNPRGVPVVLLHGYTDSWLSYAAVLPHLPERIRALALSQRGHGESDRPVAGYHPRDMAADVEGFLDAAGIERAVVVGHSMGSQVALRFALSRPERVLGLALLGGFATLRGHPLAEELRDAVAGLDDPVDAEFVRAFQASTMARPCSDSFLDMVVDESLKVPSRVWREALAAQMDEDVSAELASISAPVLLSWGDRDEIATRAMQDSLAAAMPRSRLVVHHGIGHAVHWDDAEGVAAELVAFVDGLAMQV